MATQAGQLVEFFLIPGKAGDKSAFRQCSFDMPVGALVTEDKAYTDDVEDGLNKSGLRLRPVRKTNSKRPWLPWIVYLQATVRQIVETTGSLIERILPKSIRAVTLDGFELKVWLYVLACSLHFLW